MSLSGNVPALLFDLDGTLVDSVYQHVLAWREALERCGIELAVWRIHRRIGMSGGLLVNALLRETGRRVTQEQAEQLQRFHAAAYARQASQVGPLPGASELLAVLTKNAVPWAIATSGQLESARRAISLLGVGPEVPVITRDLVEHAKPDPDLFLAAAERLGVNIQDSIVVGDSIWDLLAAQRPGRLSWVFSPGAMGRTNWSALVLTVFTRTRSICCNTWTRLVSASMGKKTKAPSSLLDGAVLILSRRIRSSADDDVY